MATLQKTINEHMKPGTTGADNNSTQRVAAQVGPFVWPVDDVAGNGSWDSPLSPAGPSNPRIFKLCRDVPAWN